MTPCTTFPNRARLLYGFVHRRFISYIRILSISLLLPWAWPAPAAAGEYRLIKGEGLAVCEAYQKNLNSFGLTEPMRCERSISPEFKDFKKPKWEDMTEEQTFLFFMEKNALVLRSTGSSKTEAQREGFMEWVRERIKDRLLVMQTTQLDIDNDGAAETILIERNGNCPMHEASSISLAVLTEDGKHYDLEKSRYINDGFSRVVAMLKKDVKHGSVRLAGMKDNEFVGNTVYDVFIFNGKAYFDMWVTGVDSGRLHVFLRTDEHTRNICTYRFNEK